MDNILKDVKRYGNQLGSKIKKHEERLMAKYLLDTALNSDGSGLATQTNLEFLYNLYEMKMPDIITPSSDANYDEILKSFILGVDEVMFADKEKTKKITLRLGESAGIHFAEHCEENNISMQKFLEDYVLKTICQPPTT